MYNQLSNGSLAWGEPRKFKENSIWWFKINCQRKKRKYLSCNVSVKAPQKPVVQTAGILSEDSGFQLNKKIKDRLGQKSASQEVTSTTEDPSLFSNPGINAGFIIVVTAIIMLKI